MFRCEHIGRSVGHIVMLFCLFSIASVSTVSEGTVIILIYGCHFECRSGCSTFRASSNIIDELSISAIDSKLGLEMQSLNI